MISISRSAISLERAKRIAFLVVSLSLLAARDCSGAIIITAPTIVLPYSAAARTGSFEVYVQSTEASPPQVGAANVELQTPTGSGVTFTLPADPTPTAHPYLFQPQSPTSVVIDAGRTVEGSDFVFSPLPSLANGNGLLLVDYRIAAGTFGDIPLTFVPYSKTANPVGTALFDASNLPLATTFSNGLISIAPPIPEPSAWMLALIAAVAVGVQLVRAANTNPKR